MSLSNMLVVVVKADIVIPRPEEVGEEEPL